MSLVITPNEYKISYKAGLGDETIKGRLVRDDQSMDGPTNLAESSNIPGTYYADCPVEFEEAVRQSLGTEAVEITTGRLLLTGQVIPFPERVMLSLSQQVKLLSLTVLSQAHLLLGHTLREHLCCL
jgi:hypothetical protein